MQIKALLLSVVVAGALNVPLAAAERPGIPAGWSAAGQVGKQFEVGYDEQEGAVYLRSLGEPGEQLGALTQTIDARPYIRQTLMLSAEVKTEDPKVRAELFMRTVGPKPGTQTGESVNSGAGWNAGKDWTETKVQVGGMVDEQTRSLDFGLVLQGKGKVWIRNVRLVPLGPVVVQASNMPLHMAIDVAPSVGRAVNLTLRP